jgi:Helix-turn-helix domain
VLIYKAYRFRIYPNRKQISLIHRSIGCTRFVQTGRGTNSIRHCVEKPFRQVFYLRLVSADLQPFCAGRQIQSRGHRPGIETFRDSLHWRSDSQPKTSPEVREAVDPLAADSVPKTKGQPKP